MPGQVGRYQGEDAEGNAVLAACQSGAKDPRKYFPMLSEAVAAMVRVLAERNSQRVKSQLYGTWIPEERWAMQRDEGRLPALNESSAWMFSPCVREWTVQGGLVGGTVNIAPGWSVVYTFGSYWLPQFAGCKVTCYFDPAAPTDACEAVIVLAENVRGHKAGEVLGNAAQVNKVAKDARAVLGWGDDCDQGLAVRKAQASFVRREVRILLPGGRQGPALTEARTADAAVAITVDSKDGSNPISTPSKPADGRRPAREAMPLSTRADMNDFVSLDGGTQDEGMHQRATAPADMAFTEL